MQGPQSALFPLFDVVVMDESSQVDVGKALFPLCLLAADGQTVLLGDHLQMPPVIATQPPRGAEWLVGSIQEYLLITLSIPVTRIADQLQVRGGVCRIWEADRIPTCAFSVL